MNILATLTLALTPLAAPAPELAPAVAPVQDPQPEAATKTIVTHAGSLWREGKHEVHGAYRIERTGDDLVLVLENDFRTKSGPGLKVVLSPLKAETVRGKTALQGSINLGTLASHKTGGRYAIPKGTDLARYQSVLIHCEEYAILWGAAPLRPGQLLAHGTSWTKKSNKISGGWEIAQVGEQRVVRLGGDFSTRKAPDLKLVLSPTALADTKNANALSGSVVIAPLTSHKGAQAYVLPNSVDLSQYRSLLVHCEQYTKLWGGVPLPTK